MPCGAGCVSAGREGTAGRAWNPNAGAGAALKSPERTVKAGAEGAPGAAHRMGLWGDATRSWLDGTFVDFYLGRHAFFYNCFPARRGAGPGRGGETDLYSDLGTVWPPGAPALSLAGSLIHALWGGGFPPGNLFSAVPGGCSFWRLLSSFP